MGIIYITIVFLLAGFMSVFVLILSLAGAIENINIFCASILAFLFFYISFFFYSKNRKRVSALDIEIDVLLEDRLEKVIHCGPFLGTLVCITGVMHLYLYQIQFDFWGVILFLVLTLSWLFIYKKITNKIIHKYW
ncbi:MAG: hypothetical protein OEX08_00140 [Candidatus Nomurabacteria bacterium]|nr:hypothetical protein [Candidatus Nomurabacteria bacterium]